MSAGSIYDTERGSKPPRYSINGRVVEGTIVDRDGRDIAGSGTRTTAGKSVAAILGAIRQAKAAPVPENPGLTSRVAEAIAKYRQIRQIAEQFPNPGTADIAVHRSGIMRKPDPRDLAYVAADKANRHLATLEARLVMLIEQYVVTGKKSVMDAINALLTMNTMYPAAMQPFGELLDEFGIELMLEAFKQGGLQLGEIGLAENARAATYRPVEK
jgi:hypothetical protein